MMARYVSIQPIMESVMKFTIPVTVAVNIRDFWMSQKKPFAPGKSILARAYAQRDARTRLPNVPPTEMRTVLKM